MESKLDFMFIPKFLIQSKAGDEEKGRELFLN
jgi:hypothetical protein